MDCVYHYPGMYIYAVELQNSEDRIPAMSGGLKALFILICSVLVLYMFHFTYIRFRLMYANL